MNQIDDYLKGGKPDLSYAGATDPHSCQVCLDDMMHDSWHLPALYGSGGPLSLIDTPGLDPWAADLGAVSIWWKTELCACALFALRFI